MSENAELCQLQMQRYGLKSIERDSVRCYYCDMSIGKWRDHVYNRDPFVEHCLTHPYCPHIILTKGLVFVD
ncbi:hypothetical protein MAR_019190, partial [Mya arenaria]